MTVQEKQAGYTLVVGLGKTGLSVVRHLYAQGERLVVVDSRDIPPGLSELMRLYPEVRCVTGQFDESVFVAADRIIVSPGIAVSEPALQAAREHGVRMTGDVDLFIESVAAPVIAITGSNGKSTVTRLVTEMANASGIKSVACGNIGLPMLEAIDESIQLYVVELSSFQLETVDRLPVRAAVVLNVAPDHLDRYDSMESYAASKRFIYHGAERCVINKDDPMSQPDADAGDCEAGESFYFTMQPPEADNVFGLASKSVDGEPCLYISKGVNRLIAVDDVRIKGMHNIQNAMAALALGTLAGLDMASMLDTLKIFEGLPHRAQLVGTIAGVNWINDSKATNVGAAVAAITGIPGTHVLIAGGMAKESDFSLLAKAVEQHCRAVVLIGRDAKIIAAALPVDSVIHYASSIEDAVSIAQSIAEPGDNVLLSPACASFDMFVNFEQRGDMFMQAVRGLAS